jgi:hypothetical protein
MWDGKSRLGRHTLGPDPVGAENRFLKSFAGLFC